MSEAIAHSTFWLVLAQALLPPSRPEVAAAFVDGLAEDLTELALSLDLDIAGELARVSAAARAFAEPQSLLVEYSRAFLPPNNLSTLNLSRYVDGSINGPCMDALENAYQAAGIEQRETLRDLSDHGSVQMECLAWLLGQTDGEPGIAPETFARICLVGALPRFAAALTAAAPESPYTHLIRIAAQAIARYAEVDDALGNTGKRPNRRHDTSLGVWRHCKACDKPFAREKEIQIMARALEQAGLPAEHLGVCPDCRDVVKGFFRRSIK